MHEYLNHKNVLFITTKNLDYIRNTQEITILKESALSYRIIGSYAKNYVLRLLSIYWNLLTIRFSQFDTVMVGFAPQLVLPFWNWKMKKVDVVIDFFISMYDTLCCDRQKFHPKGVAGRILHKIDEYTLEQADFVICDTKAHGRYFCEEFHCSKDKLLTMYLEADTAIFYPREGKRPEYLEGKYVVLYFGSVLPLQGIEVVLKAMSILKGKGNIHFFFIGPIAEKKLLDLKPVSANITYIDWLSQDELAQYIAMADLCLAGHFHGSIQKAFRTIPGKAYIYSAMGKKMILGDNPANHEIFEEDERVSFVEMGNEKALANEIIKCMYNANMQSHGMLPDRAAFSKPYVRNT